MVFPFLKGRIFLAQIIRHAADIFLAHVHKNEIRRAICPGLDLIPDWIVKRVRVARKNEARGLQIIVNLPIDL